MSLRDMFFNRLDDAVFAVQRRRSLLQPQQNRVISYRNPETKKRPIAAFGADPSGFGEDWASYRLPKTTPVGPVPLESHENVHGFIHGKGEPPVATQEPYQDVNLSPSHKSTNVGTDQRPISGLHEADYDKPITLHNEPKKSFESDLGKNPRTPTPSDIAEKDQKAWNFDFRS